jgi:arsenical pump membrane protein
LALIIAALAIVLLAVRPWRVPGWIWPVAGALLVVFVGHEAGSAALGAIARQWNVLLFILGLLGISAAAEESGAFTWIADFALHRARGSHRRLFILLFLASAVVTLALSNDATAIALTPIVYQAVRRHADCDVKPFLFACIFTANTASFGLPFSNPANVLILPHARLLPYLAHLGPPQAIAIALNLGIFLFFFRNELRGEFSHVRPKTPTSRATRSLYALAAVAVAYVVALGFDWPLGPVAILGALLTLALAGVSPSRAIMRISWKTLVLLAGLFVLLDAVTRAGYVSWALAALDHVYRYGSPAVIASSAIASAFLSNVLNNLPVAVAGSYIVAHSAVPQISYPLILGVDVGPNFLTSASLATLLWLSIVRGYGVRVSLAEYARLGVAVAPATIAIGIAWLFIVGSR